MYNDEGGISDDVKDGGEEFLADIISHQEQRAFLQEDNANRVEGAQKGIFWSRNGSRYT